MVDGPDRALDGHLPDGVAIAVQEEAKGTADAVLAAREHFGDGPVVVLSGDVPLVTAEAIAELLDVHARSAAAATMLTLQLDDPGSLGRVVRDRDGGVARVEEVKGEVDPAVLAIKEANAGIYVFDGRVLEDALRRVGTDNAQGEAYLPDALFVLKADGRAIGAHVADDATLVLGVNDRADLARVRAHAQARINAGHMRDGVTIVDPAATYVDAGVTIGADTVIEPGTTIRGGTTIGERCTIRCSYLDGATLEDGVTVGPFAYLRPGAVLRQDSKAGTFVEIKNSDIGEGTKVPHLSYIGDADVGAGTNLGAAPSPPTTTAGPSTAPRWATGCGRAWTRRWSRRSRSATAPTPGPGASSPRTSLRAPSASRASASATSTATPNAARSGEDDDSVFTAIYTRPGMSALVTQAQSVPATSLPIGYDKRLMLFSGRANPELGHKIADNLGVELGPITLKTFSNGEVYCRFEESIRGADVFLIQPTCGNPVTGVSANDALFELLAMIDAAVGASAHRVIAVTPWFGYSRQDKKSSPREPISARLVARCLEAAGADRVLTMDLHAGQVQGFFNIPVDHMTALMMLTQYFKDLG